MTIEYKTIPCANGYQAGSDGSIWSCLKSSGRQGLPQINTGNRRKRLNGEPRKEDGRLRYTIRLNNGLYRRTYGSILVLESFIGICPDGFECCHNNGNCLDDSIANLRWDTPENNRIDKCLIHKTHTKGEEVHTAKLTEEKVKDIRRKKQEGYSNENLSKTFNVTKAMISNILNRKNWKHVN